MKGRRKWRQLSLEVYAALLGYRVEIDLVPFQFAKPQFGHSSSMGRKQRLPSLKCGPLHIWVMECDRVEIGLSADLRAHFHSNPFERVYPNTIVWPDYKGSNEDANLQRLAKERSDGPFVEVDISDL